jgi:hypothetical protein
VIFVASGTAGVVPACVESAERRCSAGETRQSGLAVGGGSGGETLSATLFRPISRAVLCVSGVSFAIKSLKKRQVGEDTRVKDVVLRRRGATCSDCTSV